MQKYLSSLLPVPHLGLTVIVLAAGLTKSDAECMQCLLRAGRLYVKSEIPGDSEVPSPWIHECNGYKETGKTPLTIGIVGTMTMVLKHGTLGNINLGSG